MRVRKKLIRKTGFRDGKCIVIATEGAVTEYNYFRQMDAEAVLSEQRFQIEVLRTTDGKSAPNHVMKRLSEYKKKYNIKADDELWMVIDRDKWTDKMISEIIAACKQKGFGLCISNSCFEVWLLLHFEDLSLLSLSDIQDLLDNKKLSGKSLAKRKVTEVLGKSADTDFSTFFPNLLQACNNAKLLEESQGKDMLVHLGSQLHKIFEGKI